MYIDNVFTLLKSYYYYYATAMARFASILRRRNVDPGPRWIRDFDVVLVGGGGDSRIVDDGGGDDTGKGDGFGHVMMSFLLFAVVDFMRVMVVFTLDVFT